MVARHITPVELTCPHCNTREKVTQTGDHVCFECNNKSVIDCDFKSGGVEIVYRHWWDGMSPRMSTTIHHILDYDQMPYVTIKPPPPAPGAESIADRRAGLRRKIYKCPHCNTLSQQEVLKHWTCRHCGTYVPPHPNDIAHAAGVAKSGYDRKAARTKALQRSELRWIGAAFVAVIVIARFVTAHDLGSFVGDVLTLGLGAAIGLTFFKPDKR